MFKLYSAALLICVAFSSVNLAHAGGQDYLDHLAKKYAPELREHEGEKFPLANARWIWERSGIVFNGETLVKPGDIPNTDLDRITVNVDGRNEPIMRRDESQRTIKGLALVIPEKFYKSREDGVAADPVCYAYARRGKDDDFIDISYIFFNPYNGTASSGIFGVTTILDKLGVGHHEGDIEHITVRLDSSGNTIKGVHYARHGHTEGSWYTKPAARITDDKGYKLNRRNQIVTWSALDTHGNSNRAGSLKRKPPIGFFGDLVKMIGVLVEKTSSDGRHYDCRKILDVLPAEIPVIDKEHEWMNFRGVWGRPKPPKAKKGSGGPTGVLDKDWWDEEPLGPR